MVFIARNCNCNDLISAQTDSKVKAVLEEIFFIEGMRDYRKIHCENSKIMTLETFGALEEKLPGNQFCRVHKSFMVAIDKIASIERGRITIQEETIPVSETYREHFYKLVKYPSK